MIKDYNFMITPTMLLDFLPSYNNGFCMYSEIIKPNVKCYEESKYCCEVFGIDFMNLY